MTAAQGIAGLELQAVDAFNGWLDSGRTFTRWSRTGPLQVDAATLRTSCDDLVSELRRLDCATPVVVGAADPVAVFVTVWACLQSRRWVLVVPGGEGQAQQRRRVAVLASLREYALVQTADLSVSIVKNSDAAGLAVDVLTSGSGILQATSGTTGAPKLLAVGVEAVLAHITKLAQRYRLDQRGLVSTVPPYHDLGLIGGLITPVAARCDIAVVPPATAMIAPQQVWSAIELGHAATLVSVPFMMDALTAGLPENADLGHLNELVLGGEVLLPLSARPWMGRLDNARMDPRCIHNSYGMAEAVLMVSSATGGMQTQRCDVLGSTVDVASAGVAIDGTTIEIEQSSSEFWGEIIVRAPSLAVDAATGMTRSAHATGDLGTIIDGELYPLGRFGDMITVNGVTTDVLRIEAHIRQRFGLRDIAVIQPYADNVDDVLVLIRTAKGEPTPAGDLHSAITREVMERLGVRATTFPVGPATVARTSSGKLRRAETFRRFSTGSTAAPEPEHRS